MKRVEESGTIRSDRVEMEITSMECNDNNNNKTKFDLRQEQQGEHQHQRNETMLRDRSKHVVSIDMAHDDNNDDDDERIDTTVVKENRSDRIIEMEITSMDCNTTVFARKQETIIRVRRENNVSIIDLTHDDGNDDNSNDDVRMDHAVVKERTFKTEKKQQQSKQHWNETIMQARSKSVIMLDLTNDDDNGERMDHNEVKETIGDEQRNEKQQQQLSYEENDSEQLHYHPTMSSNNNKKKSKMLVAPPAAIVQSCSGSIAAETVASNRNPYSNPYIINSNNRNNSDINDTIIDLIKNVVIIDLVHGNDNDERMDHDEVVKERTVKNVNQQQQTSSYEEVEESSENNNEANQHHNPTTNDSNNKSTTLIGISPAAAIVHSSSSAETVVSNNFVPNIRSNIRSNNNSNDGDSNINVIDLIQHELTDYDKIKTKNAKRRRVGQPNNSQHQQQQHFIIEVPSSTTTVARSRELPLDDTTTTNNYCKTNNNNNTQAFNIEGDEEETDTGIRQNNDHITTSNKSVTTVSNGSSTTRTRSASKSKCNVPRSGLVTPDATNQSSSSVQYNVQDNRSTTTTNTRAKYHDSPPSSRSTTISFLHSPSSVVDVFPTTQVFSFCPQTDSEINKESKNEQKQHDHHHGSHHSSLNASGDSNDTEMEMTQQRELPGQQEEVVAETDTIIPYPRAAAAAAAATIAVEEQHCSYRLRSRSIGRIDVDRLDSNESILKKKNAHSVTNNNSHVVDGSMQQQLLSTTLESVTATGIVKEEHDSRIDTDHNHRQQQQQQEPPHEHETPDQQLLLDSTNNDHSQDLPERITSRQNTGVANNNDNSANFYRNSDVPTVANNNNRIPRIPQVVGRANTGDLGATCSLKHSVGRTRKQLNQYLQQLKLKAVFGQSAVSSRNNVISHITLNSQWNYIPTNTNETLEWWLGDGKQRFKVASLLTDNPVTVTNITSTRRQNGNNVNSKSFPIFWAKRPDKTGRSCDGGDICYYIGHFSCILFHKFEEYIVFRNKERQALVEFQFDRFDSQLDREIAKIPFS